MGGSKAIKVDVRVIAATNRDLEKAVTEGRFRRDLYFRLHVIEVRVPPLRHRREDVVELAWYFLERFNEETGRRLQGFTEAALNLMREYRWPGNVRELKNVVERAVVLARGEWIDVEPIKPTSPIVDTRSARRAASVARESGLPITRISPASAFRIPAASITPLRTLRLLMRT